VKAKIDRLVVYQKYLEKVVESAEEFHEIREILSRHDTLTSTYQVRHTIDIYIQVRQTIDVYILVRHTIDLYIPGKGSFILYSWVIHI